jgi:hypothetical protein
MPLVEPGRADEPQPAVGAKTVRVLTIGNSFSNNATTYLGELAAAAGHTLSHRPMHVSGASLEVHWNRIVAHDADPEDPAGLYGARSLRAELRAEPRDLPALRATDSRGRQAGGSDVHGADASNLGLSRRRSAVSGGESRRG